MTDYLILIPLAPTEPDPILVNLAETGIAVIAAKLAKLDAEVEKAPSTDARFEAFYDAEEAWWNASDAAIEQAISRYGEDSDEVAELSEKTLAFDQLLGRSAEEVYRGL